MTNVYRPSPIPHTFVESPQRLPTNSSPHVAWGNWNTSSLDYALLDRGSWVTEVADSSSDSSKWASLAVDSNDVPHIGYQRYGATNKFMYTTKLGGSWTYEIVHSETEGEFFQVDSWISVAVADRYYSVRSGATS